MCYILIKDVNEHGCVALKTKHGKDLVDLKTKIEDINKDTLQVVTISRPSAFMEYAPYCFVDSADELINIARKKYLKV